MTVRHILIIVIPTAIIMLIGYFAKKRSKK